MSSEHDEVRALLTVLTNKILASDAKLTSQGDRGPHLLFILHYLDLMFIKVIEIVLQVLEAVCTDYEECPVM
jgi:hypothetical protein